MKKIKKIAITGGKGGAGKSTVAILLANKLIKENKKVILCDCDVECPNDYLLLDQKLRKVERKTFAEFPQLIKSKCKKCGLCVKNCPNHAIFQAPGRYPIFIKKLCLGCGLCWNICPYQAIRPKKEETGKIYFNSISNVKNFYLITGMANPFLEETGPIVRETKKFAMKKAKKIKADYVIFDTAAGTHCPVINALLNVDFVYAVTEPTPMGAYDLDLILDLCKKMKIPTKIILNKANLGDKKSIEKIAKKFSIKIEKTIPYSENLFKAYSKGQLSKINNLF